MLQVCDHILHVVVLVALHACHHFTCCQWSPHTHFSPVCEFLADFVDSHTVKTGLLRCCLSMKDASRHAQLSAFHQGHGSERVLALSECPNGKLDSLWSFLESLRLLAAPRNVGPAVFLDSPPTRCASLVPPAACGSWPLLAMWDPRCFPRPTANLQHTLGPSWSVSKAGSLRFSWACHQPILGLLKLGKRVAAQRKRRKRLASTVKMLPSMSTLIFGGSSTSA